MGMMGSGKSTVGQVLAGGGAVPLDYVGGMKSSDPAMWLRADRVGPADWIGTAPGRPSLTDVDVVVDEVAELMEKLWNAS